ncbi:MAG: insulinase family protein [Candidatus Paceibacterota bacterium]
MNVKVKKLKNGFKIIYLPFDNFSSTVIRLLVPAGSFLDGKRHGLAHMVEHMATKWIENRIHDITSTVWAADHLVTHFESGINRQYAYFSFDVHHKDAKRVVNILRDMLILDKISLGDLTGEKNIILSEIRDSIDSSSYNFEKDASISLGDILGVAHPVLGYSSSVRRFTNKIINNFFVHYYQNTSAILVVSGKVTSDIQKEIETSFNNAHLTPSTSHFVGLRTLLKRSRFHIVNNFTRQSYCTIFYPLPVKNLNELLVWKFVGFVLYDYLRYVLRENGYISYSTDVDVEDLWQRPVLAVRFSVEVNKMTHALQLWQDALSKFSDVFTQHEYIIALRAYIQEIELDKDYPITQAKNFGHYAMLFGLNSVQNIKRENYKKLFSQKRVIKNIHTIMQNPHFLHIVASKKRLDEKKLRKDFI